jgi:hypothetical protein
MRILFCPEIDSPKIQKETQEALTLLLGSENICISNDKYTISMHTTLIFKEQARISSQEIKREELRPTSLLNATY